MKNFFRIITGAFFITFALGCSSTLNGSSRLPSSNDEILTSKALEKISALEVLSYLKNNWKSGGVMIEPTSVSFWNQKDIEALEKLTSDSTPASPVVSSVSSISCKGSRYTSTVGREARHLISAIKKGRYPLSLCSTYDLKLIDE